MTLWSTAFCVRVRPAPPLRGLLLAGLVAALLTPSQASSHWERTRWAMTIAELQSAYPAARKLNESLYRIEGPFVIHGYRFEAVAANFDKGRLWEIYGVVAAADVMTLQASLARSLGSGRSVLDRESGGFVSIFNDSAGANTVLLYGTSAAQQPKGKLSLVSPTVFLPDAEKARRRPLCASGALPPGDCLGV